MVGTYYVSITKYNQIKIENVEFEKDIEVIFDNELEFDRHITEKTSKAHSTYGMLRRKFKHFIPLFKSMSRSQLEYASVIWNPYKEIQIQIQIIYST